MNLVKVGNMHLNYLKYVFILFQKIAKGHRKSDDSSYKRHCKFDTLLSDVRRIILQESSQIRHTSIANETHVHQISDDIVLQSVIEKPTLGTSKIRRCLKKSEGTVLFMIAN